MYSKLSLSLGDAKAAVEAAQAYAASHGFAVSIAVVDESTYLQYLVRMDGAPRTPAPKARWARPGPRPRADIRPRSSNSR